MFKIDHRAGPDTRVARVGYENSVGGKVIGQFPAEAFRKDWHGVRVDLIVNTFFPGLNQFLHAFDPSSARLSFFSQLNHFAQRVSNIALHPHFNRIITAQFFRVNIELDDRCSLRWDGLAVGDLSTGVATDKEDQVGFTECLVGASP